MLNVKDGYSMFTGLIEEVGKVMSVYRLTGGKRVKISCSRILEDVQLGDSISTNGVCLTVVKYDHSSFEADIMNETLSCTTFRRLKMGQSVNLERALKYGARLGGHRVSGHVHGTAKLKSEKKESAFKILTFETSLASSMRIKESVSIDGISLTITSANSRFFSVSIIPKTTKNTNLSQLNIGSYVNIECEHYRGENTRLTLQKLQALGY
jgi:riboflavin synthase